jgi:membrane protease YdiL (CAAX protease family)
VGRRYARRTLLIALALNGVWFLLMRQVGGADMYSVLGPYGLAVCMVLWRLRPRALARWLAFTPRACLTGVVVGVAMTLATYPVYHLLAGWIPGMAEHVRDLYSSARTAPLGVALVWVVIIIAAEELLWRGVLLAALDRALPMAWAVLGSVALYTGAQLGSGSWVMGVMAAVCGFVWTLERIWSRSLLAPLISHLIWTPTVILLVPVA